MLVKHSEGVAVGGSGVLEVLLGIRVFPVGAAQVAAGVGEAGYILAITFGCDAGIMVEVGMGDDEVRYVLRAHAYLHELSKQVRWRLVAWRKIR